MKVKNFDFQKNIGKFVVYTVFFLMRDRGIKVIDYPSWRAGEQGFLVVGGPCSVESAEQMNATADALRGNISILRGGIWKPRTRPSSFEGVGEIGLSWLVDAGRSINVPVMTEVATAEHVEQALQAGVDMLWIGARTVVNPFSVQALADALQGVEIPLFVKNPVSPDIHLWLGAIERFEAAGLTDVVAIHRGFQDVAPQPYRNAPRWELPIELHHLRPDLKIITDVSHICGCRKLLQATAQRSLEFATDGFMIEIHPNPDAALTDAAQQLTPNDFKKLLSNLTPLKRGSKEQQLSELRSEIDNVDSELLHCLRKRMEISSQIGQFKKEHDIAVLQMSRWEQVLSSRLAQAEKIGLNPQMVKEIFDLIHKESIEKQLKTELP